MAMFGKGACEDQAPRVVVVGPSAPRGSGEGNGCVDSDEDEHPTRVHLRDTLLRLTGATPSPTDTARYHLSEALNTPGLNEPDRKQLEALRNRLLRPETLIRSLGQELYVSLLTDAEVTPGHLGFKSLRGTVNSLQSILELPFIQELSLETPLRQSLSAYQSLCEAVCQSPPAQRKELLERRVLLHSDVFKGEEVYSIPASLACKLLSCDQYGFTTKPNREGTHAVYALPDDDPQLYFKADLEGNHLTPGREGLSHCVYQSLFGEGVTPSCLLSLQGMPRKRAPFGTKAFTMFERYQNTQDAPTFFGAHPQYQVQFSQSELRSGVAQVSLGVSGESLDTFVERVRREETTYDALDLGSVSLHMLTHYILGVSDGKGDNFMVTPEGKIIGIDNDEILTHLIRRGGDYHTLGLKSLLYCIGPRIDQRIHASVRERFLSRSPMEHMLEICKALLLQNKQYGTLIEKGLLEGRIANLLSLPLQMTGQAFQALYDRLEAVHGLLREHPHSTHQGLLKRLNPLIALYYERLREMHPNDPGQALQVGYGQGRTETGAPTPSTFEELLGKDTMEGYDDSPLRLPHTERKRGKLEEGAEEVGEEMLEYAPSSLLDDPLPLQDTILSWLKSVDVSTYTDPDLYKALQSVSSFMSFLGLPFSLESLHSSWRERLLFVDEHNTTCFHRWLESHEETIETLKTLLQLPQLQNLLNVTNAGQLTVLDIALGQKRIEEVIAFINGGATACDYRSVRSFYETLDDTSFAEEQPQKEQLEAALLRLSHTHPRFRWELTKAHLLPRKKLPVAEELVHGSLEGALLGKRHLLKSVHEQLFQGNQFRRVNTHGRRDVGYATLGGYGLYFKKLPQLPGLNTR